MIILLLQGDTLTITNTYRRYNMNIIAKTEGMTAGDLYKLTKGTDVRKMSDAKGEILNVAKYIIYEDTDTEGEVMKVLAFETAEGARYATNSKTFVRNFSDILEMFTSTGEALPTAYRVGSGRSRSGREYMTCDLA